MGAGAAAVSGEGGVVAMTEDETPSPAGEQPDETTAGASSGDGAKDGSSYRWPIAFATLAVLLIVALVGVVVLWQDRAELRNRADAEIAATEEAERIVVAWLTYDYRTFGEDMAWVTESGTDSFNEEYSPEALEALRSQMVGPRELISRGRAVNSAATWEAEDRVKVLIFTDQTLTDTEIREAESPALHARSGVALTMVRDDDEWLVDEMVQLQFE